jgi:calcium permeable stress-gated cation channel
VINDVILVFVALIFAIVVGLYIEQICLICLFALKIPANSDNPARWIVQAAVMAVLLAITFTAQMFIRRAFEREFSIFLQYQ